jgi:hypothetical protein
MQATLKSAQRVQSELAEGGTRLAKLETAWPTGDLYSWAINYYQEIHEALQSGNSAIQSNRGST